MNNYVMIIGGCFLAVNGLAFVIMLWDKSQSRKRDSGRISEGLLFFMATLFGSVGVLIGMYTLRHKIRKWYFIIGIPFLIIQNIAFLYVVYLFVSGNIQYFS